MPNSLVADAGQRSLTVNAPRCSSTSTILGGAGVAADSASIAIGRKRVTSARWDGRALTSAGADPSLLSEFSCDDLADINMVSLHFGDQLQRSVLADGGSDLPCQ
ncbi:MAG: hypothetical protein ACJ8IK_07325 [Burkholderiaceae bacterium]